MMSWARLMNISANRVRDMKKGEQWVLKASMVNQAGAVHVFDDVNALTDIITKQDDIREWVLQRYMYISCCLFGVS
jgi:hypothetical protein